MNSLLLRTTLRRAPLTLARPTFRTSLRLQTRGVASSPSGKPASQTVGQAATNVKEELGDSASDLAKRIAGANFAQHDVGEKSFLGITKEVASAVPAPALIVGLAGGLPYIGASATTVYLAQQAGLAASGAASMDPGVAITALHQALDFQVTYGAVMLSFLGAIHWGFEFAGYGGQKGYSRLALGAAPLIIAWPTLALAPMTALITQWAGFTGLWWADSKVTSAGWTPKWYSQYRFYLSVLVGTCIIGSLAGTSFYGPVGGHGLVSHDLLEIRHERQKMKPERAGSVGGDVSALPADDSSDGYVVIKKREEPAEEEAGEEKQ